MRPNVSMPSREVVASPWVHVTSSTGTLTNEQIQTAALVEIWRQLRELNNKLDSLGTDGIHELIRLSTKEIRAKAKARRAKARRT